MAKKIQDLMDSEVFSEEMHSQVHDKGPQGNNQIFIDEVHLKDGISRFIVNYYQCQIGLYVELYDPKYTPDNSIEYFPNYNLKHMIKKEGSVSLNELIKNLKKLGFQLDGKFVSYYSFDSEMFINCGIDPIHQEVQISLDEIVGNRLRLRFQSTGQSLIHMFMSEEMIEAVNTMKEGGEQQVGKEIRADDQRNKQCRRTKERRIGFIIDKVKKWRDYYNGQQDESGHMVRLTLDEAAQKVDISKKSLDDYLLQIRHGRKYGFNFNEHKNEKVGSLRAFVKKHNQTSNKVNQKKIQKKQQKQVQNPEQIVVLPNEP